MATYLGKEGMVGPRPRRLQGKFLTKREKQLRNRAELFKRVPTLEQDVEYTTNNLPITDDLYDLDILRGRGDKGTFSPQQKVRYASAYAVTGNMVHAADLAGVPHRVATNWHKAAWWPEVIERVRKIKSEEFDSKATFIIDKFLDGIMDRVEHGDEVVLKDGRKVRKNVNMRDLAIALSIIFEKRALGRGEATHRTEKVDPAKMLEKLKEQFKNVTKDIEGIKNSAGESVDE